jgi:hypothetical protein
MRHLVNLYQGLGSNYSNVHADVQRLMGHRLPVSVTQFSTVSAASAVRLSQHKEKRYVHDHF